MVGEGKGIYMKYFLEKAMQEADKMKRQSLLNCAKYNVVKAKRFDWVRLFFTMLFGQATIIISLFTALSFMFEEEDWLILDKVPLFKRIIIAMSSVSPKWYIEALIIIAFAFLLPCVLGWIVALPVKLFPVKATLIRPEERDYAKRIYEKTNEIKCALDKNEITGACMIMFFSSGICAIASAVIMVYSTIYKDGQLVTGKLFSTLLGAVFLMVFAGAIIYGLNFLLYLLGYSITHNFENEKATLSKASAFFEKEWVKEDKAESERRKREQLEAIEKKKLEEKRRRAEKEEQDRLKAEAEMWAYRNRQTSGSSDNTSSSLTTDDHDDLDSLTEAMGFDTDTSDI